MSSVSREEETSDDSTQCATLGEFVDALRNLPESATVSAGGKGVDFLPLRFGLSSSRGSTVAHMIDAGARPIRLKHDSAQLDASRLGHFNVIDLLGPSTQASALVDLLSPYVSTHHSAAVCVDGSQVTLPINRGEDTTRLVLSKEPLALTAIGAWKRVTGPDHGTAC